MIASYDNISYLTDDHVFFSYINAGQSEPYPRELGLVKKYLESFPTYNNTFIDVGGHIGSTSIPYSKLFSNVVAFEPNKKTHDFFLENINLNKIPNITLYNKGVFHKNAYCKVIQHGGGNSGCFYIKECERDDADSIEVVRLDDMQLSNVDFLKIDTEGSELNVLEGAVDLISNNKPLIQVETNYCSSTYFGYEKEKIYDFFRQNNYKIFDDDGSNPLFIHLCR